MDIYDSATIFLEVGQRCWEIIPLTAAQRPVGDPAVRHCELLPLVTLSSVGASIPEDASFGANISVGVEGAGEFGIASVEGLSVRLGPCRGWR